MAERLRRQPKELVRKSAGSIPVLFTRTNFCATSFFLTSATSVHAPVPFRNNP